ncbi:unnamed protein product [Sphenostylis stenocarpa]|uniref:Uncharacterized protein n=1 Tax=Sphenostylis stenocarpa TaxID=92480 RepID=A0AA86SX94_9FABA|nr:unnamed protein product [Sphenostylis stenocarpa]
MNNAYYQISGPPVSEHAYLSPNQDPMLLNYKHVNELGGHTDRAYPVHDIIMPYSAAAQPVPSQASKNQFYSPSNKLTLEGAYATGIGSSYKRPLPHPQYSHQTILKASHYAQTLQYSQHAHHNIILPQPKFHSSLMPVGSSHTQSMQHPQYPYQSIPKSSHDFHPTVANADSSHSRLSWVPHYSHQNIPNLQPNTYSTSLNAGHSYAQSLPDPQYTHQNAQNLQHDFSSSLVNIGDTNVTMHSYDLSSFNHPHFPQEFPSSTYSSQGSGAIQGRYQVVSKLECEVSSMSHQDCCIPFVLGIHQ